MSENKYHTRYGIMTAPKAAHVLLDRSWSRLRFLEEVFTAVNVNGDGFTLQGYSPQGLAAILEDISIDVYTANAYYTGDDSTPGKEYGLPEVKPRIE